MLRLWYHGRIHANPFIPCQEAKWGQLYKRIRAYIPIDHRQALAEGQWVLHFLIILKLLVGETYVQFTPTIVPYIPPTLIHTILADPEKPTEPTANRFPAAVPFTNVSGFSSLTEALAQKGGTAGPEELTHLYYALSIHTTINDEMLKTQLKRLADLDLIYLDLSEPEPIYRFKHIITQEVVYQTLPFAQRRQLHRTVAVWYEQTYGLADKRIRGLDNQVKIW